MDTKESPAHAALPEEVWSADRELFNYDSFGELLESNTFEVGQIVYFGRKTSINPTHWVDVDIVLDALGQQVYDQVGEAASDYPDVSQEARDELEALQIGHETAQSLTQQGETVLIEAAAQSDERAAFRLFWDAEYGCSFDNVPGAMGRAIREVAEKTWQAARASHPVAGMALNIGQRQSIGLALSELESKGWEDPAAVLRGLLVSSTTERMSDAARLDWLIEKQAWIQWTTRDGSIRQCQVYDQDEDENYHVLSGDDRFFSTPRAAIDAARAAEIERKEQEK
ncbi:hypothetical protein [Paraburkholderia sp. J94]|uniref:hypothetical protein n=1 Tax=Paraburkholderia sp. J94 TaxID=2805441 RepID=UPI002AB2ED8C|nr:hypothetical protein [Paraburkholderia sp. J94]